MGIQKLKKRQKGWLRVSEEEEERAHFFKFFRPRRWAMGVFSSIFELRRTKMECCSYLKERRTLFVSERTKNLLQFYRRPPFFEERPHLRSDLETDIRGRKSKVMRFFVLRLRKAKVANGRDYSFFRSEEHRWRASSFFGGEYRGCFFSSFFFFMFSFCIYDFVFFCCSRKLIGSFSKMVGISSFIRTGNFVFRPGERRAFDLRTRRTTYPRSAFFGFRARVTLPLRSGPKTKSSSAPLWA